MKTCLIEGCEKPPRTRGWCDTHYRRWLRSGDPKNLRPRCKRLGEMEGIPYCVHGPMKNLGDHWICSQKRQRALSKYARTAKAKEVKRRYKQSPKGREASRREDAKRISIFGQRFYLPDEEFKEYAIALREERRKHQTEGVIQ